VIDSILPTLEGYDQLYALVGSHPSLHDAHILSLNIQHVTLLPHFRPDLGVGIDPSLSITLFFDHYTGEHPEYYIVKLDFDGVKNVKIECDQSFSYISDIYFERLEGERAGFSAFSFGEQGLDVNFLAKSVKITGCEKSDLRPYPWRYVPKYNSDEMD
jgi:hypothetical protein